MTKEHVSDDPGAAADDCDDEREVEAAARPTAGLFLPLDSSSSSGSSDSSGSGDHFPEKRDPLLRPSLSQVAHLAPLAVRYAAFCLKKAVVQKRKPFIDQFRPRHGKRMYGVPCGGIGAGSIGRGFRGEFCRFQMVPGMYSYHTVHADAFHVCVREPKSGKVTFQSVLAGPRGSGSAKKGALGSWEYNFKEEDIKYQGLFPRAWTTYEIKELNLRLTCHQVSPFFPDDYEDTSLPVTLFEWTIENFGENSHFVSIAFSFKNGWGSRKGDPGLKPRTEDLDAGGSGDKKDVRLRGAQMHQEFRGLRLTYAVSAREEDEVEVRRLPDFDPDSDGAAFWRDVGADRPGEATTGYETGSRNRNLAMAVRAKTFVGGQSSRRTTFCLCWDHPEIKFRAAARTWQRRYARFHRSTQSQSGAAALTRHALRRLPAWLARIHAWQRPVLEDARLPDWFKSALFNEMYFLADGGSQWLELDQEERSRLSPDDARVTYGRFGYLESHEYRMYNTYDVHFYSSFALMALFPGLELSVQTDYCDATSGHDPTMVTELFGGKRVERNVALSVPHDLGDPEKEPFVKVNSYRVHDISEWKDLNLKFVLSTYRDVVWADRHQEQCKAGKNEDIRKGSELLLKKAYPVCLRVMERTLRWDTDDDGLIENAGFPDQTYDTWTMDGPSAYCGGLWIAAITCLVRLAERMEDSKECDRWRQILTRAKTSYHEKLWHASGKYFKFDTSTAGQDTIISDQLCGHWYLKLCGLADDSWDKPVVQAVLNTVYQNNVANFADGKCGAVNGTIYSTGQVDRSTTQSEEIWTGVTYGLSSLMIAEGLTTEGFRTAEGIYRTVYERIGLGYETPEALYETGKYRAVGYMRPLSIWAMYEAWKQLQEQGK